MPSDGLVGLGGTAAIDANARVSIHVPAWGGLGRTTAHVTTPRLPGSWSSNEITAALRADAATRLRPELLASLGADERAVLEAATGEMGNKPDAVKLGWLRMRTKESWTKQRYASTVGRALAKLRMVTGMEAGGGGEK